MVRHIVGRLASFFYVGCTPLVPPAEFPRWVWMLLTNCMAGDPAVALADRPYSLSGVPSAAPRPGFPHTFLHKSHETTPLLMGYYLLLTYVPLLRATWTLGGPPRLAIDLLCPSALTNVSTASCATKVRRRTCCCALVRTLMTSTRPWHCIHEQTWGMLLHCAPPVKQRCKLYCIAWSRLCACCRSWSPSRSTLMTSTRQLAMADQGSRTPAAMKSGPNQNLGGALVRPVLSGLGSWGSYNKQLPHEIYSATL